MDREHGDGVRVRIELRGGRVVARLDERLEMARHEHGPVVREQGRLRPDDLEEAGDVLERLFGGDAVGAGQARQQPRPAQERVEHLARRPLVRERAVGAQVRDEPGDARPAVGRDAQDAGLAIELLEHVPHGAVAAPGRGDDGGQVLATERVQLRGRERVDVDARRQVRDGAQERHQEADLGPGVQPGGSREPPRDPGHVQRAQDRIGVVVRAHQDRVVAGRCPVCDPAADLRRDPVRLLGRAREGLDTNRHGVGRHALGAEPLRDAGPDLEAIRVVEADQAVRGVEHRRMRSIVAPQDHRPRTPVAGLEVEDVVDRGTPERVDRLVVVADDRHVAMPLGEEPDELRLRPVRVLELVDEDVPEAGLDPLASLGRLADESERQCDLVAEVDEAAGREEVLVTRVRPGQLVLPARRFGQGLGVLPSGLHRRGRLGREAFGERKVGAWRDVLVLASAEERRQRRKEPGRVAERAVLVELELEEVLAAGR